MRVGINSKGDMLSCHQSMKKRPINCAARNAVWVYPQLVAGRFPGAPTITEIKRSFEQPDLRDLPEGAEIEVHLYGGATTLRLDGWLHRISIERFRWARFPDEAAAREALVELWSEIETMQTPAEVTVHLAAWYERHQEQENAARPPASSRYSSF